MIPIFIELKEDCPPDMLKKQFGTFMAAGLFEEANHWHTTFLPMHFEAYSRYRYGYKPRSRKWLKRKRALAARGIVKKGGLADLVATGILSEALMHFATIRTTAHAATVTMRGRAFVQVNLKSLSQPNYPAEITKVIPAERETLGNIGNLTIGHKINEFRAPRTTIAK